MTRRGRFAVIAWLLLTAAASWLALHARYTADLSAFLPTAPTRSQQFLVQQLSDGLASRLILVDIEGADAATRAELSRAVASRLRAQPAFGAVLNGATGGFERDQAFVFAQRYLLSEQVTPERFAVAGLQSALREGIDLLASPMGLLAKDLFTRDPTGETLQVLGQLDDPSRAPNLVAGVWASRDGQRALLIARTRAAGSDAEAQAAAVGAVRAAFDEARRAVGNAASTATLQMTGPGVFAAEARDTIEREALRLSLVSTALIIVLLWSVYRSATLLLLGLMPVLSGALAGVAAVSLGYGMVHGVTLGFGVTLIGEAVDYSIYLFMQARRDDWTRTLWPTIRLGMLTSICGFASLLPSQFPGLAQLGLYSITGLLAAGLATRYVLPHTVGAPLQDAHIVRIGQRVQQLLRATRPLRHVLWLLPPLAAAVLWMQRDRLWERELSALSPVPASAMALDSALRADLGAPDVSTLVVLAGRSAERVLQAAERLQSPLDGLVERDVIAGYQSPARYLPSQASQRARQASLPERAELQRRVQRAVAGLPVRAERLQPFIDEVSRARDAPLLGATDLAGTSLSTALESLLLRQEDRWIALLPLQPPATAQGAGVIDVAAVRAALGGAAAPDTELMVLDIKHETDALYAGYLRATVHQSLLGAFAILVLLAITLRSPRRVARVVTPLVLAVLAVLLLYALGGHALTLLHLVGLLLVIAVGSNYALFFDGERSERTLASLLVANACTVLAFGALAFSSVPVLAALGGTVAPGALLALLFSAWLAREATPPALDAAPRAGTA